MKHSFKIVALAIIALFAGVAAYAQVTTSAIAGRITDTKGVVYKDADVSFLQTQQKKTKRKMTSITTGSQINAGHYNVVLTGSGINDMLFDNLTIE